VTATQRSRLALLRLVIVGALAVPAFAATTSGMEAFRFGPIGGAAALLRAPPPVLFMAVGTLMVLGAVGRRLLKTAASSR